MGHPDLHRYAPPEGLPELVDGLLERSRERSAGLQRKNLLVTAGATAGITVALASLLEPGDEVLVLAPHWPLISGIVRAFHGRPVEVPFHGRVHSADEAVEACREQISERTVALYYSTPNNPTGDVLPRAWVEALVSWAREQNLWVLGDLVFEDLIYDGEPTDPCALAPERSFAFRSFSKTYGLAGYRCGHVTGPLHTMARVRNLGTQLVYGATTASQVAVRRALEDHGSAWLADARERYRATGEEVARRLGVPPPHAGIFLFLDLADRLGELSPARFLQQCASRGLLLAGGSSFGNYESSVRLCFTAAPPEQVLRGVDLLVELLGR